MLFEELRDWLTDNGFTPDKSSGFSAIKNPDIAKQIIRHTSYLPSNDLYTVRIRIILLGHREPSRCYCGNPCGWSKKWRRFQTYCSNKCIGGDPSVVERRTATLRKNNDGNWYKIHEKAKATLVAKHGSLEEAERSRLEKSATKSDPQIQFSEKILHRSL